MVNSVTGKLFIREVRGFSERFRDGITYILYIAESSKKKYLKRINNYDVVINLNQIKQFFFDDDDVDSRF